MAVDAVQKPRIDWSKAEPTVFCSMLMNYGTPCGPTGRWSGWNAGASKPDKIIDPTTGRRDLQMVYHPLVELYDQKDPQTIKYHMDMVLTRS